jgi:xylan 1,4-beta-xylosidase
LNRAEFLKIAGGGSLVAALPPLKARSSQGETLLKVAADSFDGELYNFWSTSVTTGQDYFLDADRRESVREIHPFAKYINCVRFLGGTEVNKDGFFRGAGANGEALADFSDAVRYVKGVLDFGFTPRIVLDNVPISMSRPAELNQYGNTLPPQDFGLWHSYIRQLIQALVKAFGRDQVSRWRFRVGTEPDLYPGHWTGSEQDYYKHYDYTVDAVTSVIPEAEIGPGNILNPEESLPAMQRAGKEQWGLRIVDHCAAGKNYKTGKTGTRLCFFGMSWYGRVGRPVGLDEAAQKIRERLSKYRQFGGVPVDIQEFSVLTDEWGARLYGGDASEWSASWMAAVTEKVYRHRLAQVYQWSTTTNGIPHPRTHVMTMLERMQAGKRLRVDPAPSTGEFGCIAGAKGGGIDLLVYRHKPEREDGEPARVRVGISGLAGDSWRIARGDIIDHEHSGYIHALYKDLADAGIKPLEKAPLLGDKSGKAGRTPVFGAVVSERYGPEGQKFFNVRHEKYRELGRLRALEPLPALAKDSNGISLALDLAGHSVAYLRLER